MRTLCVFLWVSFVDQYMFVEMQGASGWVAADPNVQEEQLPGDESGDDDGGAGGFWVVCEG